MRTKIVAAAGVQPSAAKQDLPATVQPSEGNLAEQLASRLNSNAIADMKRQNEDLGELNPQNEHRAVVMQSQVAVPRHQMQIADAQRVGHEQKLDNYAAVPVMQINELREIQLSIQTQLQEMQDTFLERFEKLERGSPLKMDLVAPEAAAQYQQNIVHGMAEAATAPNICRVAPNSMKTAGIIEVAKTVTAPTHVHGHYRQQASIME